MRILRSLAETFTLGFDPQKGGVVSATVLEKWVKTQPKVTVSVNGKSIVATVNRIEPRAVQINEKEYAVGSDLIVNVEGVDVRYQMEPDLSVKNFATCDLDQFNRGKKPRPVRSNFAMSHLRSVVEWDVRLGGETTPQPEYKP